MPLVSVSAHDIDTAGLALEAELPPGWLAEELADAAVTSREVDGRLLPGHVAARLSRSGADIIVRGRVRASLTTPCARCTEPAPIDVDTELSLLLQPAAPAPKGKANGVAGAHGVGKAEAKSEARSPKAARERERDQALGHGKPEHDHKASATKAALEEEYEFSSAEADHDTYDGETVVLDPFVREAILLEVPNFPLCSEDCPGIRPAAAPAPEAVVPPLDPRLAPLGALRSRLAAAGHDGTPGAQQKKKKE